jgi:hypothetical protein
LNFIFTLERLIVKYVCDAKYRFKYISFIYLEYFCEINI